jgi:hypothetical protein
LRAGADGDVTAAAEWQVEAGAERGSGFEVAVEGLCLLELELHHEAPLARTPGGSARKTAKKPGCASMDDGPYMAPTGEDALRADLVGRPGTVTAWGHP